MPSAEEFLTQGQPATAPMSAEDFLTGGPPQKPSFLGQMGANFANAGQAANDLFSGNYQDIGHTTPTPKTEALNDKMFPPGYQGGLMETLHNAGNNISPNDVAGALNEKFGETPEGKALAVIGGAHPIFNAAGTAINNYVNPAIEKYTGIGPETLKLLELGLPAIGGAIKIARGGSFPEDPLMGATKNMLGNMGEESGSQAPASFSPVQIKGAATAAYQNSEKIGGQIPIDEMRQTVNKLVSNKDIGQQTTRGQQFAGENPASQTLAKLQEAVKDNQPWSIADANEIHDSLSNDISKARRAGDYAGARQLTLIKQGLRDTYKSYADANPSQAAGFNEWLRGDKLYSAGSAAEDIQDIIDNGNRADVPSTAIKNGFKAFVKNDDNRIGLNDEEWAAAEHAAKYGVVTPVLKTLGSRLSGHIAGGMAGLAEGGMGGGVAGYLLGNAAVAPFRWGANALQAGRGQNIIDTISQRPVVQEALNPNYTPPVASLPSAPLSTNPVPALMGGALGQAQQKLRPSGAGAPAAGQVGLPQQPALPASPAPQSNAAPDISGFSEAESGNNPNAKSQTSSASGLYGFTNRTWADMIIRYGKQTGLTLQDKSDPRAQAMMASLLAKDNIKELTPILGRMPSKGELYMAHFLGAKGAATLLNADPQKEAIMLFPRQVFDANRSVFFNGKQPRTVGEVRQLLNDKVA